jgi:hypothetical protein
MFGVAKMGLAAFGDALRLLGYDRIYHMREVNKNEGHAQFWTAALSAKIDVPHKPSNDVALVRVLEGYQGLCDIPAAILAEELMAAYPSAKLILTTRPMEAWMASMRATIVHYFSMPNLPPGPMNGLRKAMMAFWGDDFERGGRAFYTSHNAEVRRLAASQGRELLDYDISEGWGPLCQFLGKDVPEETFPRNDDWIEYKKEHGTGGYTKTSDATA